MNPIKSLALPCLALFALSSLSVAVTSGPQVGTNVSEYIGRHVTGDAAGKDWCPVCHYGRVNSVQAWMHGESMDNAGKIAQKLEAEMKRVGKFKLRAFVVFQKPDSKTDAQMTSELKAFAKKFGINQVSVMYVKAGKSGAAGINKINLTKAAKSTIFTYKARKVLSNFVNLKTDAAGLAKLDKAVKAFQPVAK